MGQHVLNARWVTVALHDGITGAGLSGTLRWFRRPAVVVTAAVEESHVGAREHPQRQAHHLLCRHRSPRCRSRAMPCGSINSAELSPLMQSRTRGSLRSVRVDLTVPGIY